MKFQSFNLVLEKAEEPEIKLPTSAGSWEKQERSRKTSISAVLNMPANFKNSAMATGLEKVSFHFNPKETQCQRMFKLLHSCTSLIH